MLSRDDIRRALLALADELGDASARCEIVVVGGAAVVLLYNAREATKDVDVLILGGNDPALVRTAVQRVAGALGLPDDWLNDAAKGYVHGLALGEVLLDDLDQPTRAYQHLRWARDLAEDAATQASAADALERIARRQKRQIGRVAGR